MASALFGKVSKEGGGKEIVRKRKWEEERERERKGECQNGEEKAGALKAQNLGGMAGIRHVSPTTSSDL